MPVSARERLKNPLRLMGYVKLHKIDGVYLIVGQVILLVLFVVQPGDHRIGETRKEKKRGFFDFFVGVS